ncbi:tetratricopeptide repeat protein [Actinokineospora diospyrosa]|uniref:tetratricopeptide repeat protein n=1 Tax=Actinokineospora diospyrosa TaxID=103728 RepID=UPI0020A5C251|nr:tetratricopeptide repeat protein [Actinokineospora diospyrosa]
MSTENRARDAVAQFRDNSGQFTLVQHAAPGPLGKVAGQVVTGKVPRQPQAFRVPAKLDELRAVAASGVAVVVAVTGQRGVGKTQLAAEYARERVAQGWLVGWIAAETSDSLTTDLLGLADALGLRGDDEPLEVVLRRLHNHLNAHTEPGLLVFDNVTDPGAVADYLPVAGSLQVIITSTSTDTHNLGTAVSVDVFAPDTAVAFLIALTGIDDPAGAAEVAAELGYLPLALALAGARIRDHERDFAAYLSHLNDTTLDHLTPPRGHAYPTGLAKAISLSAAQVEAEHPHARLLLDALALLSPDGVHRDFLDTLLPTRDALLTTAAALRRASLIDYAGEDGNTLIMHRLTQRTLREGNSSMEDTAAQITEVLSRHLPTEEQAWQHRDIGTDLARQVTSITLFSPVALQLANMTIYFLDTTANPATIAYAEATHAHYRHHLGDSNPDTLKSANNLAGTYQSAGRLSEAVILYEQTLNTRRETLGNNHPDTLTSANNLAGAYESAGRLSEAIALHEQTLNTFHETLGNNHPDTLTSANNLAGAYESAGRLSEAIALHEQTLNTFHETLGNNHPDTLTSANNLAHAYKAVGRINEAVALYRQASEVSESTLGPDHPWTLSITKNYAVALAELKARDQSAGERPS